MVPTAAPKALPPVKTPPSYTDPVLGKLDALYGNHAPISLLQGEGGWTAGLGTNIYDVASRSGVDYSGVHPGNLVGMWGNVYNSTGGVIGHIDKQGNVTAVPGSNPGFAGWGGTETGGLHMDPVTGAYTPTPGAAATSTPSPTPTTPVPGVDVPTTPTPASPVARPGPRPARFGGLQGRGVNTIGRGR